MLLKTTSTIGENSKVKYINGSVSFHSVKLNVYSFEVDGVLIDTGSQTLQKEFKSFFNNIDVDKVLITHFHEDHTGGAAYLQSYKKLPIYMNELTIESCTNKANYPFYRKLFWGKRKPFNAIPLGDTFTSRNATWDVIKTPGHAEDHLSFLNRQTGQMFSGDLYVHPKTRLILRDESIPTIINSINKLLSYDFDELFCCHAGYTKNGRKALTRKLTYLQQLQDKVITLHKRGYNEKEINKIIFKKRYPITYFSRGEWSSIHIIRSIIFEQS